MSHSLLRMFSLSLHSALVATFESDGSDVQSLELPNGIFSLGYAAAKGILRCSTI